MFRKRRIQAALGQAAAMPPPSISMSRPLRSRDPGPSIPAAPGRCPLHQGQLGWNMLMPCEACIGLAYAIAVLSNYSPCEASASSKHGAEQRSAVPGMASSATLERPSQGSDGVPPPPPPPIACFRHRGGRGWSLSDPCEACLQLAFDADLG